MERKTPTKLPKVSLAAVDSIRLTERAHILASESLLDGDIALDGTAGKGHDTVFLANAVGSSGHVHAFDIQSAAIDHTRHRLESMNLRQRVTLHQRCHSELALALTLEQRGRLGVALFNLGYLPGGDKTLITQPETTRLALHAAITELRKNGRLICVVYPGHNGGLEESAVVQDFAALHSALGNEVHTFGYISQSSRPWILAITRWG